MKQYLKQNKQTGFTLVEVLIVVAIISLLASIALIAVKEAREKAKVAKGLNFGAQVHHNLGAFSIGIWDFDEGTGGTVGDTSGNGNDGTITGATWSTEGDTPTGKGYALNLDGDDYVNMGSDNSLEFTQYVTVSAWVKLNSDTTGYIVAKDHWLVWGISIWSASTLRTYIMGSQHATSYDFPLGSWTHVVYTYDQPNSSLKHYINGEEVDTFSESAVIDTAGLELVFGKRCDPGDCNAGSYFLDGLIDEVHIYAQSLTSAQVKKLYAEGLKRHLTIK